MMNNGILDITLTDEELAENYSNKRFLIEKFNPVENEYIMLRNSENIIVDKLKYKDGQIQKVKFARVDDFKPKNYKQDCAFDLMSDMNTPIKILAGVAGSGKTMIALRYAFHFLQKGAVGNIMILRHNVAVGERNGFFPGTKEQKLIEWLGSIKDNLPSQESIDDYVMRGTIELEAVECIKGRSIANSFIIVDECEDLTVEQFKVIGERVSHGSVIAFVGDYEQTSQQKYVQNNGLVRALKDLRGNPLTGIVVFNDKMNDNVRSETSKVFTYVYNNTELKA